MVTQKVKSIKTQQPWLSLGRVKGVGGRMDTKIWQCTFLSVCYDADGVLQGGQRGVDSLCWSDVWTAEDDNQFPGPRRWQDLVYGRSRLMGMWFQ